jgi:hypothetical protein
VSSVLVQSESDRVSPGFPESSVRPTGCTLSSLPAKYMNVYSIRNALQDFYEFAVQAD